MLKKRLIASGFLTRAPRQSLVDKGHSQVCIPRAAPRPSRTRKSVRGSNPFEEAMLYLSVDATIINASMVVPVNSTKKHEISVM